MWHFAIMAQAIKRIYIANDDHTDYMWTANGTQYDSAFIKMLDYYLDQIDSTKSNPSDFQARFNCDGNYWLRAYQKFRTPAQFNRLIKSIRTGHISSPLNFLVSTYGAQPTEAVIRGMYPAGKLEREYNLRFQLAVCMENQTLPLGLSSLWAGSGAKYSWRGVCGCDSRLSNKNLMQRKHQLYKYTGLDNRSVIMKWYSLGENNARPGGYAEARGEYKPQDTLAGIAMVIKSLEKMCDTISSDSRYPYNTAGAFGYGWDDLATYVSSYFINAAKTNSNNNMRVRVSNEEDFFKDVETNYPNLPAESVTYGNEWDLYSPSMNETTAKVRRALEQLRGAEALYTLIALKNKNFANGLGDIRRLAWESYGMYWEHDWTSDGPTSRRDRAGWQTKICRQITAYTDILFKLVQKEFGTYLLANQKTRFYVFNPLSWERDDVADVYYNGNLPVRVVDISTGKETISQVIIKQGKTAIRIWAENIPSVGYKIFEISHGKSIQKPKAAKMDGEYFSNALYKLRLKRSGVITELYDKETGRQLIKTLNDKFANDLGTKNLEEGAALTFENAGPVSVTIKTMSKDPLKHSSRITLFSQSPRIEIEDSIQENFADVKEWAFSFDLKDHNIRHEELGCILKVKKQSNGGNYANQNARYDWQTFNHFADISEERYGITLSNIDCSFFKLGNSTIDSLDENSTQLRALAGGQVDRYVVNQKDSVVLGINNQNGQKDFRYQFAITANQTGFNPVNAMKFSMEHQNPLITGMVTGEKAVYPESPYSLIKLSNPNVLLWSLKPSEEGIEKGIIARFWNINNEPAQPFIIFNKMIERAWQTSHIETNEKNITPDKNRLQLNFGPQQINTYRILLK
ncbi:MAG: glycosyl hydrolase-related protein [Ginsengibacter sp.]